MAKLSNLKQNILGGIQAVLGIDRVDTVTDQEKSDTGMSVTNKMLPHESKIMWIQSLLVWENPQHTAALFIAVNLVFWLLLQLRLFYIIGIIGFCAMTYDLWFHYIWPEIRVPPPFNEDNEEWTHVHPRMLSVHDICAHLGNIIVFSKKVAIALIYMRSQTPLKFYVCSVCIFTCVGLLGHHIPGAYLVYFFILCIFLLPMLYYHKHLDYLWESVQPVLKSLESNLSQARKCHTKRVKNAPAQESDTEDELKSLMPLAVDPSKTSLTPANPDTESGKFRLSPDLTLQDDNSDDDTQIQGLPSEMPSILSLEDTVSLDSRFCLTQDTHQECSTPTLDDTSDEESLCDVWDSAAALAAAVVIAMPNQEHTGKPMQFVAHHFEEFEDKNHHTKKVKKDMEERSDQLEQGLEFPDVDATDQQETDVAASGTSACTAGVLAETQQETEQPPNSLLLGTVSSLMQSAVAGLTQLGDVVKGKQQTLQQDNQEQEEFEVLSPDDLQDGPIE